MSRTNWQAASGTTTYPSVPQFFIRNSLAVCSNPRTRSSAWFPNSVWERRFGKLRFASGPSTRNGVSKKCVPKRSLGTRGNSGETEFGNEGGHSLFLPAATARPLFAQRSAGRIDSTSESEEERDDCCEMPMVDRFAWDHHGLRCGNLGHRAARCRPTDLGRTAATRREIRQRRAHIGATPASFAAPGEANAGERTSL